MTRSQSITSVLVLVLLIPLAGVAWGQATAAPGGGQTLSDVPLLGRYAISRVLGREESPYHAQRSPVGSRVENRAHGLTADFRTTGVDVRSGTTRVEFRLMALGYGSSLAPVASSVPSAARNRIEYRRGALTEWYLNGPLGLQQGFTLERAPARNGHGALTLSLRVDGNVAPAVHDDAQGLTFETKSTGPPIRYSGLTAYDASGRTLEASLEVEGNALFIRVDDAQARYPVVIDPFLEKAKLTASDGKNGEEFGSSVSISGDTVVVGVPLATVGSNVAQGAAYVFVRPVTGWSTMTETAKLTASDGAPNDSLGAVSVNGDTIVVGALGDAFGRNTLQGSAYVFVKPGPGWSTMSETAKLTAVGGPMDGLGQVSISGPTIVGGAPQSSSWQKGPGAAHVFPSTFLTGSGSTSIGGTRNFTLDAFLSKDTRFQVASALSAVTGFWLGDVRVGLDPDGLWLISTTGLVPSVFQSYAGSLDSSGRSTRPRIKILNAPALVGISVHSAYLTHDQSGVVAVSDTSAFQITP